MPFYCLFLCPTPHCVAPTQCKFPVPVTPQSTCLAVVPVHLSEGFRTPPEALVKERGSFRSVS